MVRSGDKRYFGSYSVRRHSIEQLIRFKESAEWRSNFKQLLKLS